MKLVTAIVQEKDADQLSDAFIKQNFRATKYKSTGGFLREGNITFLVAVENEKLDSLLNLINENSKKRKQFFSLPISLDFMVDSPEPVEVEVGGATVFVQNIERFEQY